MDSEALNRALHAICDLEELSPPSLRDTGKSLPYIGWFWRDIDFNHPISLAQCDLILAHGKGEVIFGFVGFVPEKNWGYSVSRLKINNIILLNQSLSEVVKIGAENLVAIERDKLAVSDFATFHQVVITAYGAMV